MNGLKDYLVNYLEGYNIELGLATAIIALVAVLLWIIVGIIFIKISKLVIFVSLKAW